MRALVVGLVAVLFVVGCSADGGPSAEPTDRGSSAEVDRLAFADQLGAGLRLSMVRPASFRADEAVLSDQAAVVIADLLYDGLTEVDVEAGGQALGPALARSWRSDDEFRRWTFALDPDRGVTADVVVDSLEPLVLGSDGQLPRSRPGAALTAEMVAVSAVDAETVQIDLAGPNAGLPWILSGLPFSVVGLDGASTGDYEVVADDARSLRLERRIARGGRFGPFDEVEVVWVDEPSAAYRLLLDGAVDGAIVGQESIGDAERRLGVDVVGGTAVRFYVLNPGSAELADRDHRAALLAMIDAGELVAESGRHDLATIDGLVPASMAGHRLDGCGAECGELENGTGGGDATPASWPSDVPLRVTYAGDGQAAMAQALAGQLEAAGLPASSRQSTARGLATAIVEGSPDLFAFGWVAPAGSVDAVLPPLLRGDSPANVARFASAGIEILLDEAASTGDDETRWDILARAHRLALTEAKVLPVASTTGTLVFGRDLPGVSVRGDGSLDLESFE